MVDIKNKHFGRVRRPTKTRPSRLQPPTKQSLASEFTSVKPLPNCQTSSAPPQLYSPSDESHHSTHIYCAFERSETKSPIKPYRPDTAIQISQIANFISSRPQSGRSALSAPKWLARGPIVMSKSHRPLRQNLGTQRDTITIQPLLLLARV